MLRYRSAVALHRLNNTVAKPWNPVFTLDGHEVTTTFAKGGL